MIFTANVPSEPGFYLFKKDSVGHPVCAQIASSEQSEKLYVRTLFGRAKLEGYEGFWCKLVPESEKQEEIEGLQRIVNYLDKELGSPGEHSSAETVDNVKLKLIQLEKDKQNALKEGLTKAAEICYDLRANKNPKADGYDCAIAIREEISKLK